MSSVRTVSIDFRLQEVLILLTTERIPKDDVTRHANTVKLTGIDLSNYEEYC